MKTEVFRAAGPNPDAAQGSSEEQLQPHAAYVQFVQVWTIQLSHIGQMINTLARVTNQLASAVEAADADAGDALGSQP